MGSAFAFIAIENAGYARNDGISAPGSESERRALTALEKIVDVAGNSDSRNQVADLGTGCRELNSDSDDDQDEADDSQIQGQIQGWTPGPY